MSEHDDSSPVAVRTRTMEVAVALIQLAFGLLVLVDSWRLGARWAEDGPQAGYFPFYIGLAICAASLSILRTALRARSASSKVFLTRAQMKGVFALLLPLTVYVALIGALGIYVASAIFIAYFMWRHGHHHPLTIFLVALGVPVFNFWMFEIWFKIPLPKGLLERWIGLG